MKSQAGIPRALLMSTSREGNDPGGGPLWRGRYVTCALTDCRGQRGSTLPAVGQDGDSELKVIFCLQRVELCPLQKDKSKS